MFRALIACFAWITRRIVSLYVANGLPITGEYMLTPGRLIPCVYPYRFMVALNDF